MVHSTWPSQAMQRTHAPTFNRWHKKKKNENKDRKVTLHMLTHDAMRGCGLTSLVIYINDKSCDIRERNVTIRSEIWTMNICSVGFQVIRVYHIMEVDITGFRVYRLHFHLLIEAPYMPTSHNDLQHLRWNLLGGLCYEVQCALYHRRVLCDVRSQPTLLGAKVEAPDHTKLFVWF
jgi:hypothetical protein